MRRRLLSALVLLPWFFAAEPVSAAPRDRLCQTDCVTAFALPPGTAPFGIGRGPLDSMWFTHNDAMARIDRRGRITTYPVPTPDPFLRWVLAERGVVWFTESDRVGRITPRGTITEYPLPTTPAGGQGIVRGPDGNLYITEQDANAIARLNPRTGRVREFPIPTPDSTPLGLAVGPDGALWFIERTGDKVGRMTLNGTFTEYPLTPGAFPNRIVSGPDGALWFTELLANKLGRITTDGVITEYPIDGGPVGITIGNDCQLYVVLSNAGDAARVNLNGTVTGRWDLPGANVPLQIAPGFDRDIWITNTFGDSLFRLTPYARHRHDEPPAGSPRAEEPSTATASFAGPALVKRPVRVPAIDQLARARPASHGGKLGDAVHGAC
jgi:virginiamycin B lyase